MWLVTIWYLVFYLEIPKQPKYSILYLHNVMQLFSRQVLAAPPFREQVMKNMICQQLKKYTGEVNLSGDNHKTSFFFKTKLLQVLNAPSMYV
jgi:hypothetical protein